MASKPVNPFAKPGAAGVATAPAAVGAVSPSAVNPFVPKVNPFTGKVSLPIPITPAAESVAVEANPSKFVPAPISIPATPPQQKRSDSTPFSPSALISHGAATINAGLVPSPLASSVPVLSNVASGEDNDDPYDFHVKAPVLVAPVTHQPIVPVIPLSAPVSKPVAETTDALAALNPFPKPADTTTNYKIRGSHAPVTLAAALTATEPVLPPPPAVPPPLPPLPPPADDFTVSVPDDAFSPTIAAAAFDNFDDPILPVSTPPLNPSISSAFPPVPPLPLSAPPAIPPMCAVDQFGVALIPTAIRASAYDYEDPLEVFSLPKAVPLNSGMALEEEEDLFGNPVSVVPSYAAPPPVRREGEEFRPGPKSILDASNSTSIASSSSSAASSSRPNQTRPTNRGGRAAASGPGRSTQAQASRGTGRSGAAPETRSTVSSQNRMARLREHYAVDEPAVADDDEYDLVGDEGRPRNIRTGRGGVASRTAARGPDSQGNPTSRGGDGAHQDDDEDEEEVLEMEGDILARTDTYSLFSKEWKPHYWVIKGSYLLLYANV